MFRPHILLQKREALDSRQTGMGENNLDTCLQFVIGMPGETPESIKKTAEFASYFF